MRVIIKEVGKNPIVTDIKNELEDIQSVVGGYLEIVPSQLAYEKIAVICNEEGLLMGLKPNMRIGYNTVVGNILFTGVDGGEFCDLSDEQIELIMSSCGI